jgi:hypothetical protein
MIFGYYGPTTEVLPRLDNIGLALEVESCKVALVQMEKV